MKQSIYEKLNDHVWLTRQVKKLNKNCAQIARELGISNRSAVNRAVKRLGLSDSLVRTKYPKLSDRVWLAEQIKAKTLVEIAEELGTTVGNVGDRVKRYNLSLSGRSTAIKAGIRKRYPNGRYAEKSSNWKGGRRIINGYVALYSPEHPNRTSDNLVFEHRLVAEMNIGRQLHKDEVVHHINGDKQDNSPENLEVCKRSEHVHRHFTDGDGIQYLTKRIIYLEKLLKKNNIDY